MPRVHKHAATQSQVPWNTRRAAPHNHTELNLPSAPSCASTVSTASGVDSSRRGPLVVGLDHVAQRAATTPVPHDNVSPFHPTLVGVDVQRAVLARCHDVHVAPGGRVVWWWCTGKAADSSPGQQALQGCQPHHVVRRPRVQKRRGRCSLSRHPKSRGAVHQKGDAWRAVGAPGP